MIDEGLLFDVEAYFQERLADNDRFWARLGGRPPLEGAAVLDFACGHGALAVDLVRHGVRRVLGIDLSGSRIAFARERTSGLAPPDVLEFRAADLHAVDEPGAFDMIVSRDAMEHVDPLEPVLETMVRLLRPGGTLRLGFSPLYYSPFGDHGELGRPIPWAHVAAGEQRVLAAFNRTNRSAFKSLKEAGFNMLTPRAFFRAFAALGCAVDYLNINPAETAGKRAMLRVFDLLRRLAPLEPYCTVSIYIVLRKPGLSSRPGPPLKPG